MRTYEKYNSSHSVIKCLQSGRDWMGFDHGEKIHLLSTCSFEKQKSRFLTNFPDFNSIFKTFFRSGKLLGKFQEFKTLYEPWKEPRCKGNLPVLAASDIMATSFVPFIKLFLCDTMQSKTQRLMFNYTQTTLQICGIKETILELQAIALCGLGCHSESEKYWEMKRRSETRLLPKFMAYIRVSFRFRV